MIRWHCGCQHDASRRALWVIVGVAKTRDDLQHAIAHAVDSEARPHCGAPSVDGLRVVWCASSVRDIEAIPESSGQSAPVNEIAGGVVAPNVTYHVTIRLHLRKRCDVLLVEDVVHAVHCVEKEAVGVALTARLVQQMEPRRSPRRATP